MRRRWGERRRLPPKISGIGLLAAILCTPVKCISASERLIFSKLAVALWYSVPHGEYPSKSLVHFGSKGIWKHACTFKKSAFSFCVLSPSSYLLPASFNNNREEIIIIIIIIYKEPSTSAKGFWLLSNQHKNNLSLIKTNATSIKLERDGSRNI